MITCDHIDLDQIAHLPDTLFMITITLMAILASICCIFKQKPTFFAIKQNKPTKQDFLSK